MQIERKTPEKAAAQDRVLGCVSLMIEAIVKMLADADLDDQAKRLEQYEL